MYKPLIIAPHGMIEKDDKEKLENEGILVIAVADPHQLVFIRN